MKIFYTVPFGLSKKSSELIDRVRFADSQIKAVVSDGLTLVNYLQSRHRPIEQNEKMEKKQQFRVNLEKKCK